MSEFDFQNFVIESFRIKIPMVQFVTESDNCEAIFSFRDEDKWDTPAMKVREKFRKDFPIDKREAFIKSLRLPDGSEVRHTDPAYAIQQAERIKNEQDGAHQGHDLNDPLDAVRHGNDGADGPGEESDKGERDDQSE